jgi:hypothetical protein
MPKLSIMNSLRQRWKRSIPSDVLNATPVLNIKEGEAAIVTYTSASDKMKVFSALIRRGLKNGAAVSYAYPDEESKTVRAKLKEHRVNVEKYEKKDALYLKSLTEYFISNGKLDFKKEIRRCLTRWTEFKRKGYKHLIDIQDLGNFSFINGQWQKYVTDYWLDSTWMEWTQSENTVGTVWTPFIMEITAVNVEHLTETEVTELLKAFGGGDVAPVKFIDLLENRSLFSQSIGLDHERLVGRKVLLEFDPVSNYEKIVDSLTKESMANVEPIFVFTSSKSSIHTYLAKQPTIKFFLTSLSTSTPKSSSENTVLLPAKNVPLILDTLSKVLETYADANICFVFDILSDLLTSVGPEKTFIFLRHALDMLSSEKVTSLFLLNTSAHNAEVVSRVKMLLPNLLTYDKNGLEIIKTP